MITIHGKSKYITNKLCIQACEYYLNYFFRKNKKLNILIRFDNDEHLTEIQAQGEVVRVRRREYVVSIKSTRCLRQILMHLAHEVCHIKQYEKNELKDLTNDEVMWCGKVINDKNTHYYDHPWEVECFGREYGLYIRFVTENQINSKTGKLLAKATKKKK